MKKIMVVEDDNDIESFLELAITEETPYQALIATHARQALDIIQHDRPDLFLIDYFLPGGINGIQLYDQLQQIPEVQLVPKIMISASLDFHQAELTARGLTGLSKPVDLEKLLSLLDTLLVQPSSLSEE